MAESFVGKVEGKHIQARGIPCTKRRGIEKPRV